MALQQLPSCRKALYEVESKLLKGGYIEDDIWEYYRVH